MAATVLCAVACPEPARAAGERVAIIPAIKVEHQAGAISEVRQSAVGAVRTVGGVAVLQEKLTPAQLACQSPQCIADIATNADASHVLRVDARLSRKGFKLRVELWGASPLVMIDSKDNQCERCSLIDLQKAVREATTALCGPVLSPPPPEEETVPQAPVPVPPVAAPLPPPPLPEPTVALPAPLPSSAPQQRSWRWMGEAGGIALGAIAAASFIYGGHLLSVDGDPSCGGQDPTCAAFHRNTLGDGLVWTAVGIGTLTAGAILFIYSMRSGKASTSTKTALRPTLGGWELAF